MENKYTEIFKLKSMLEESNIPFEFNIREFGLDKLYQICYPKDGYRRKCSVIQGNGTYGGEEDLLEIMGLLTDVEEENDSVLGYLTVENVFDRIEKDFFKKKPWRKLCNKH